MTSLTEWNANLPDEPSPGLPVVRGLPFLARGQKVIQAPRAKTKLAIVIALLSRNSGASLKILGKATGWKPHTMRAALTRLRQRGYNIARRQSGTGPAVYCLQPKTTLVGLKARRKLNRRRERRK